MKSHEFIQAAANMLAAFGDQQQAPQADITASGKLHQVEPEYDDHTEPGGIFVAPLQAKLELLKKAVNVDSIYDEEGEDSDLTGHGDDNEDELDQIKKLSGINIAAVDEMASSEPLDV
jgi:hypothetical protein